MIRTSREHTDRGEWTLLARRGVQWAGRHSTAILTVAITVGLLIYGLGADGMPLALMVAALGAAAIVIRRHPTMASSALSATVVVVAACCVSIVHMAQVSSMEVSLVAGGWAVAAPVPMVLMWLSRPEPARPGRVSWVVAGVQLVGLAAVAVIPHTGAAFAVFGVSMTAATLLVWRQSRAHRQVAASGHELTEVSGWFDFGTRDVAGKTVDRVVVGKGHVVPVWHSDGDEQSLAEVLRQAHQMARVLQCPAQRLQPVILTDHVDGVWRRDVSAHEESGNVILASMNEFPYVLRDAPTVRSIRRLRSAVAALPIPRSASA